MHGRGFSSIPSLCLLDARSTPSVMTTRNFSKCSQMSPVGCEVWGCGCKTALVEKHCLKSHAKYIGVATSVVRGRD